MFSLDQLGELAAGVGDLRWSRFGVHRHDGAELLNDWEQLKLDLRLQSCACPPVQQGALASQLEQNSNQAQKKDVQLLGLSIAILDLFINRICLSVEWELRLTLTVNLLSFVC